MTERGLIDPGRLTQLGKAANQLAGGLIFSDYRSRLAERTRQRHDSDLALFRAYLESKGVIVGDLAGDPEAWRGVTWGLAAGWRAWMVQNGYAVASVNVRLSTLRVYARMASQAGYIEPGELTLIQGVGGYRKGQAVNVDNQRQAAGQDIRRRYRHGLTRQDGKPVRAFRKLQPVRISSDQAAALKARPDNPQGRRDRVLLCLLLDHALRVGELAGLVVENIDLTGGIFTFYRPKVKRWDVHQLTQDAAGALAVYIAKDAPASGPLLRGSRRGGSLDNKGLSTRAIAERVRQLGALVGLDGLSPHDCRHYAITRAARLGTGVYALRDFGGWSNLTTASRYVEAARIANQGVLLE